MMNIKYTNISIINLVISLIIPFLIIGSFLPDLIVSFSSLMFLIYVFRVRNYYYLYNKPLIIFFIFCIICIFCSLLSDDVFLSLESSLFYFRIGIFSSLVWFLIDKDKSILKYFYYMIIICFSLLVLDGFYQYFNEKNVLGYPIHFGYRISSFFGDELVMGSYLSRLFPLLFALFLIKKKSIFETYFIGVLFIFTDILIYISGERTAFFFLNLSTIFIIVLIKQFKIFRLFTFIIGLVCISILSLNTPNLSEKMLLEPARNIGIIDNTEDPLFFTPVYDSHYKTAIKMFLDKPLAGHGPKMFRIKCSDPKYATGIKPCSTHPHNFYIQLLAETGLLGFSFLFILLSYVIYCSFKQLSSILRNKERFLSDYQVCLLAGILISVWPFSPNMNFFGNWLIVLYCLPFGLYLQSVFVKNRELNNNN